MLRIAFQAVSGLLAAWVAIVSYRMWQAAAQNSASPGAIVLLGIAGLAALVALVVAVGLVVELCRRLS